MTPDHWVIGCRDLAQGEAWAQRVLGVELLPGGRHDLMGTHNRLLNLGEGRYLELIAIDPAGGGPQAGRRRWFDLDDAAVQGCLSQAPALLQTVYRVPDLDAALAAWGDPGFEAVSARRGALAWRVALRADGRRVPGKPMLIEWGDSHPTQHMPPSPVRCLSHTDGSLQLETPRGEVTLRVARRLQGSCHCGAVQFAVTTDFPELTQCDCSMCKRRSATMVKVHESAFELLAGQESLSEYQFHTHTARHFFCKVCGIYPFHRKRVTPDNFGINVACLEGFDPTGIPLRQAVGAAMA